MKRYKNLLCCLLALALMVGIVIPLVQTTPAQASDYTLTVLNPMGYQVPRQSMPLADRQPLIDKLEARGEMGPVKILLLNYDKNNDQMQMWALAIVLAEEWERLYPGTTVEIVPLSPPGGALTYGVNPPAWDWATNGTVPRFGSPWGPKTGYSHINGMPYQEEPFQRYQHWATNYDFALFGEQN